MLLCPGNRIGQISNRKSASIRLGPRVLGEKIGGRIRSRSSRVAVMRENNGEDIKNFFFVNVFRLKNIFKIREELNKTALHFFKLEVI